MKKLLIATTNKGKLEEFHALLEKLRVKLVTPADLGLDLEVEETGATYADNAALKASAYCLASGLLTLADDSGLEVEALGGAPGLLSARYVPEEDATDAIRRKHLLENLKSLPRPWKAEFHAVVSVAIPAENPNFGMRLESVEGICRGEIISREKGSNGFGYDPIFWVPDFNRTMAELTMEEKNQVSHRARAVISAMPILQSLL